MALTGEPLYTEQIKAWIHGPVVPAVWHEYRHCGSGPIPRPTDLDRDAIDPATRGLLDEV